MYGFVESQHVPTISGSDRYLSIPIDFTKKYSWAEEEYQAGNFTALVAVYKNIPADLQKELRKLVSAKYCKNLFLSNFFEASLLLLSSGILPNLKSLVEPSKEAYAEYCSTQARQKAGNFISSREPDDIIVLVLDSEVLIGSMTIFAFDHVSDMPSLSYLQLQAMERQLPNVPAVEIGRLARSAESEPQLTPSYSGLLKNAWIAAAFLVARNFVEKNGLVAHPNSYICGDTYGSFLSSLNHFFPIKTIPSSIRTDILSKKNPARDVAIYFLQRQVLGSFGSTHEFIEAIDEVANFNPKLACRIFELMENGLKKLGIKSLHHFDAGKFKIEFFYFRFHHEKTRSGFARLEKVNRKLAAKPSVPLH
jgi:hypothetical protein